MSEIEALRAELAELRAALDQERAHRQQAISRRRLLSSIAGLGAAGAVGIATAETASASDGDALTLGASNSSSSATALVHDSTTDEPALTVQTNQATAMVASNGPVQFTLPGGVRRALYAEGDLQTPDVLANGIEALTGFGFAVIGNNSAAGIPALHGENNDAGPGLGAASSGHGPQLVLALEQSPPAGPPATYAQAGSIRFDGLGDLWLCVASGEPATWTRLLREDTGHGRIITIAPIRVLDTRAASGRPTGSPVVPGQVAGARHGGQTVTLDLSGAGPIPASATGVTGNVTAVTPTASGFLRVIPAGTSANTSALNFAAQQTVSNGFTCRLTSSGLSIVVSAPSGATCHLVVDITSYVT